MSTNLSNVKVEIVLPNYNSAPYLEETINSIINQTFENWNLTIVDGNSNNETSAFTVHVLCHVARAMCKPTEATRKILLHLN